MENAILIQLYSFFIYLISGMVIGVFFDIFRILRKSFRTPDIITYIEDIIFWLFTGFFLLCVLFQCNNGEIRIYHIIGLMIGIIFYMLSISKFFIKINVLILTFVKKVLYKIIRIILYPIKAFLKIVSKIFAPLPFFVINIKKILSNSTKNIRNKGKKIDKKEKMTTERRILKRNVEKYN